MCSSSNTFRAIRQNSPKSLKLLVPLPSPPLRSVLPPPLSRSPHCHEFRTFSLSDACDARAAYYGQLASRLCLAIADSGNASFGCCRSAFTGDGKYSSCHACLASFDANARSSCDSDLVCCVAVCAKHDVFPRSILRAGNGFSFFSHSLWGDGSASASHSSPSSCLTASGKPSIYSCACSVATRATKRFSRRLFSNAYTCAAICCSRLCLAALGA